MDLEHCPNCGGELKIIAAILAQSGNREDPHAPGVAGQSAATYACPQAGAASGLTIPIHHFSYGPAPRAAGDRLRPRFPGELKTTRRSGFTHRRLP